MSIPPDAGPGTGADASRDLRRRHGAIDFAAFALLFAAMLAFPLMPGVEGWMATQGSLIIIYIIATQGVAILTGYTGLVTVGHGGFLAIGAYTAALLTKHFGLDMILAVLAGGAMAALIGALLGLVFLRLAGAFMAIGTLGFAFFIGALVNNIPIFEGREGISLPRFHVVAGYKFGDLGFYVFCVITLALTTVLVYSLVRSGVGRALKALRDAEKAAEASGVNRWFYRTLAFTTSAFVTGIAGSLSGLITYFVGAEVYSDVWYSVDMLVAAVVGGSAMMMGPFVGGFFMVMVPFFFEKLADLAFILKGVVLIGVLIFAPAGICEIVARPIRERRRRALEAAKRGPAPVATSGTSGVAPVANAESSPR